VPIPREERLEDFPITVSWVVRAPAWYSHSNLHIRAQIARQIAPDIARTKQVHVTQVNLE